MLTTIIMSCGSPGVLITKDLSHQLYPHQIPQQRINGGHLEQKKGPRYKHQDVTAGKIIQKILEHNKSKIEVIGCDQRVSSDVLMFQATLLPAQCIL